MNYLRVADLGADGLKNALDLSVRAKSNPAEFGPACPLRLRFLNSADAL